jgi:hypothetical protein
MLRVSRISSKEGRTVSGRKCRPQQTALPLPLQLSMLPTTPRTNKGALFTWFFPSHQDISKTTCAFSFLGVKQTLISPGACEEL